MVLPNAHLQGRAQLLRREQLCPARQGPCRIFVLIAPHTLHTFEPSPDAEQRRQSDPTIVVRRSCSSPWSLFF